MARFPIREAEIVALARGIGAGLADHAAVYPAPPVAPAALLGSLNAFLDAKNAATAAQAAAEMAVAEKRAALQSLVDDMKAELRYAESVVKRDDARLKMLGWGGRAVPAALVPPGQPLGLEAPRQGGGWVGLGWKAPMDGGAVAAYRIQRRLSTEEAWTDAGMSLGCGTTLNGQERGKEWEYVVVAVNMAGDGPPSNTVTVVL